MEKGFYLEHSDILVEREDKSPAWHCRLKPKNGSMRVSVDIWGHKIDQKTTEELALIIDKALEDYEGA